MHVQHAGPQAQPCRGAATATQHQFKNDTGRTKSVIFPSTLSSATAPGSQDTLGVSGVQAMYASPCFTLMTSEALAVPACVLRNGSRMIKGYSKANAPRKDRGISSLLAGSSFFILQIVHQPCTRFSSIVGGSSGIEASSSLLVRAHAFKSVSQQFVKQREVGHQRPSSRGNTT